LKTKVPQSMDERINLIKGDERNRGFKKGTFRSTNI
jgi:hypothetical protein